MEKEIKKSKIAVMRQDNFQKKANYVFIGMITLSSVFIVSIFILLGMVYSRLFIVGKSFFNKLETLCGCANHISFINHPYFFSFLIFFGLVATIFIIKSILKILKFRKNTNDFIKINLKDRKAELSLKLKKIIKQIDLEGRVYENRQKVPIVFCYGIFKPKICISEGVINRLSPAELKTVLLHEKQHLLVYEPAKLFIIKTLERVLFFLPYFKYLADRYVTFVELAADGLATNGFSNKVFLAKALSKIITWDNQKVFRRQLALSFFSTTVEDRINKLIDDSAPKNKIFKKSFLLSSIAIFMVVLVLGFIIKSNNMVFASTHKQQCLLSNPTEQVVGSYKCMEGAAPAYLSCESANQSFAGALCQQ